MKKKKLNSNIKIVLSDIRFNHEVECIKELGGKIIKIDRETGIEDKHISENEIKIINQNYIDYFIDNNENIDNYYIKLKLILEELL